MRGHERRLFGLFAKRFEQSAVRLLKNIFRTGMFENPYLNPEESKATVGKSEFMKAGYDAQIKSQVLLKNKNNALPLTKGKRVYVPRADFIGGYVVKLGH